MNLALKLQLRWMNLRAQLLKKSHRLPLPRRSADQDPRQPNLFSPLRLSPGGRMPKSLRLPKYRIRSLWPMGLPFRQLMIFSTLMGMVTASSTIRTWWVTKHGKRKGGKKLCVSEKRCFTLVWASFDNAWILYFSTFRFSCVFSVFSVTSRGCNLDWFPAEAS
jgi:hypothetical protein